MASSIVHDGAPHTDLSESSAVCVRGPLHQNSRYVLAEWRAITNAMPLQGAVS